RIRVTGGPSPRYAQSAVYDPVGDRLIVFGGDDGDLQSDVWALSLGGTPAWAQLSPAGIGPGPRSRHTAIYDPAGGRMVVFGGRGTTLSNEVWALTLSNAPRW